MSQRIVISDCDHGYIDPEKAITDKSGFDLTFAQSMNADAVIKQSKGAVGLLSQRFQVTSEVMDALPDLKVIGRYGSGIDNIDIPAAKKRNIKVVYAPYFCFTDVANHTVAGMLFLSRGLHSLDHVMKTNPQKMKAEYDQRTDLTPFVRRPQFLTVGIVGFGKIGRAVARRLKPFGYKVIAYDPYVPSQMMDELSVQKVSDLSDLAQASDFLTVHTPLTAQTKNLIGDSIIRKMKPSAYILNNARGGIVEEKALLAALKEKRIAGAALDVLEEEPVRADLPFREFPNVILSPHVAFYSQESLKDLKERVMQYMVNSLQGKGEWEEA